MNVTPDEAARRAFCQSAAEAADAAIVAGLRRKGLVEQVGALEKRRSPVLFYLRRRRAGSCTSGTAAGVRWTPMGKVLGGPLLWRSGIFPRESARRRAIQICSISGAARISSVAVVLRHHWGVLV